MPITRDFDNTDMLHEIALKNPAVVHEDLSCRMASYKGILELFVIGLLKRPCLYSPRFLYTLDYP